jgi:sulfatase maturation enzyme AslB (radical SAM superfamily)
MYTKNNGASYQILTNLDCNLRCDYCYEHKNKGKNNIDQIINYLDVMMKRDLENVPKEELSESQLIIDAVGGETLMYPDLLETVLNFVEDQRKKYKFNNYIMGISSNGTLFHRKDVRNFVEKYRNVISLGLSIDGTKKIHDHHRRDINNKGSYDSIIEWLPWYFKTMCIDKTGVKGTYTHETMDQWAEGVINLITLGFKEIACNFIFEEQFDFNDGKIIAEQMIQVVDYLFDNDLEREIHVFQINNNAIDMMNYRTFPFENTNHCGSCKYMQCLGYDNKVYGCNRFCTMDQPDVEVGFIDNGEYIITNQELIDDVTKQHELWPKECNTCILRSSCPACSAIAYEEGQGGPVEFYKKKPMCGFTYAQHYARLYFKDRLIEREHLIAEGKYIRKDYGDKYKCSCFQKQIEDNQKNSHVISNGSNIFKIEGE